METAEAIRDRVRHEQRVIERLQTANARVADAQIERIWAIKSAHELGLSIRRIAAATGLSSSRIHQVLNTEDLASIPRSAAQVRGTTKGRKLIATEVKLIRQCARWLTQLKNGDEVIANLRLDTDSETEYVLFDTARVIRVLERIAADLDGFAEGAPKYIEGDPQSERKRRLAEPPKPIRRLSTREERNALRGELKLPPI
jgi:hypothetical protein